MRLFQTIEREGAFLFRWRSYLPLAITPFAIAALWQDAPPDVRWGEAAYHAWAYSCMALTFAGLAIRWGTVAFVSPD